MDKLSIIGGGIGGLVTALCLDKLKIPYNLYERTDILKEVGAGIWLSPNALQVLEYLGLLDDVRREGNSIDRITVGKPDFSAISDTPQGFIKERFGYSAIAIHRAKLQKLFLDKIPKNRVMLGKDFESLQYSDSKKIKIKFVGGAEAETGFLIGADGINSKIRNHLFPDSQLRYSGQTCWRGVASLSLNSDYDHHVYELWGNQVRFGFSKISKGKYYWFAVILDKPNGKDDKAKVQQKLLAIFKHFNSIVIELIKATPTDKIIRNDINDLKPMRHWYKGNICLIGDAAHAITPNMGQGGAQAIEDAYYLSHFIQRSLNGDTFKLFQDKRQARVNSIVNQSWTTGKVAHWKYGKGLRNLILKNIPKKLLNKKMIELYEIDKTITDNL